MKKLAAILGSLMLVASAASAQNILGGILNSVTGGNVGETVGNVLSGVFGGGQVDLAGTWNYGGVGAAVKSGTKPFPRSSKRLPGALRGRIS